MKNARRPKTKPKLLDEYDFSKGVRGKYAKRYADESNRRKIILDYAKWTALSALRSGAPIKSRTDVYNLLDDVAFGDILRPSSPIEAAEFDAWHEAETVSLCARNSLVATGWAAKLITVYLKTASYVGDLGRQGLREVIHPPIDAGLRNGLVKPLHGHSDILAEIRCVRTIKDIKDYPTYRRIIAGCRAAAQELGCSLIELEQFWLGSATPVMPKSAWCWKEGAVDKSREHFELAYSDVNTQDPEKWIPVALVSAPSGTTFRVQFLIEPSNAESRKMVDDVRSELDFYLVEKKEPDPWRYAIYHCGTGANVYSKVHWSYHPTAEPG